MVPELSCGIVCLILYLAFSVQYCGVPDTQIQTKDHSKYRAGIASRSKMFGRMLWTSSAKESERFCKASPGDAALKIIITPTSTV